MMDEESEATEQPGSKDLPDDGNDSGAATIWHDAPHRVIAPPEQTGRGFTERHLEEIWEGGEPAPAAPEASPLRPRRWPRVLAAMFGVAVVATGVAASVALARRAPMSSPSRTRGSEASPSGRPVLLAPEGLSADAAPFAVTLTWTQPPGGSPVDGYDVYRDGDLIGTVEAPAATYTDGSVVPGQTYSYGVGSRLSDATSLRAAVQVDTPVPPLKDARVEGVFDVRFEVVSRSGFQSYTGSFNRGWEFAPKCDTGACDVRWSDVDERSLSTTLDRKKDGYTGSDRGDFNSVCGKDEVISELAVEFRVSKAKAIDGEWRASRLVGTVEESEAAQLGCLSSTATLSITANLLE